jgi:hypothetical protein
LLRFSFCVVAEKKRSLELSSIRRFIGHVLLVLEKANKLKTANRHSLKIFQHMREENIKGFGKTHRAEKEHKTPEKGKKRKQKKSSCREERKNTESENRGAGGKKEEQPAQREHHSSSPRSLISLIQSNTYSGVGATRSASSLSCFSLNSLFQVARSKNCS